MNFFEINSNEQTDDVTIQVYLPKGLLSANFNWLPHKEVEKRKLLIF